MSDGCRKPAKRERRYMKAKKVFEKWNTLEQLCSDSMLLVISRGDKESNTFDLHPGDHIAVLIALGFRLWYF
jgi:hypothetical protein